jgi:hypothetical protein
VGEHRAHIGAAAEALVVTRLLVHGHTPLAPRVIEPFDIAVLTDKRRFRKLQIKGSTYTNRGGYYEFNTRRADGRLYQKCDVDYCVAVAMDIEMCWVIPISKIKVKKININPNKHNQWSRYLERWQLH